MLASSNTGRAGPIRRHRRRVIRRVAIAVGMLVLGATLRRTGAPVERLNLNAPSQLNHRDVSQRPHRFHPNRPDPVRQHRQSRSRPLDRPGSPAHSRHQPCATGGECPSGALSRRSQASVTSPRLRLGMRSGAAPLRHQLVVAHISRRWDDTRRSAARAFYTERFEQRWPGTRRRTCSSKSHGSS